MKDKGCNERVRNEPRPRLTEKHYHFWLISRDGRARMAYRSAGYKSPTACKIEAAKREPDPRYRFTKSCTFDFCPHVRRRLPGE